jgi:transposase
MAKLASWELSDELWERVEPLLPPEIVRTKTDEKVRWRAGRRAASRRRTFAGILFVLRTGCQWNAAPVTYGSGKTIHRYFLRWSRAGVFAQLWLAGLAEYDDMAGIAWKWQSVDGAMVKAPLGGEATGANPTDRGKKRNEAPLAGRRPWRPAVPRRQRSQSP